MNAIKIAALLVGRKVWPFVPLDARVRSDADIDTIGDVGMS